MIDWKPIAEAPKDGRMLLLWERGAFQGRWRTDKTRPSKYEREFRGITQNCWLDESNDEFGPGICCPTHYSEINPP